MLSREKRAADDQLVICGLKKVMYFWRGLQRNGRRSKGVEYHPHLLSFMTIGGRVQHLDKIRKLVGGTILTAPPPALYRGDAQVVPCEKFTVRPDT